MSCNCKSRVEEQPKDQSQSLESAIENLSRKLQELESKFNAIKPKLDSKDLLKFNDRR